MLGKAELKKWFDANPRAESEMVHCDDLQPYFVHPEANCIEIEYPSEDERLPFLARLLATVSYEERDFRVALLWMTEWDVWSPREESIGYRIIEGMNIAAGQPLSFEMGPGHLF